MIDAGLLEAETVGVGLATGRDQEMAALDRLLAVAVANHHLDLRVHRLDADDGDPGAKVDALAHQRIEHDAGAFRVLACERLRRFQHRHRGAEPAKGLRQLEADRDPRRSR